MSRVYLRRFHNQSVAGVLDVGTPTRAEHRVWLQYAMSPEDRDVFYLDDSEVVFRDDPQTDRRDIPREAWLP